MKNIVLIFIFLCLASSASGQSQNWTLGIQNLQKFPSTEQDVERLFYKPKIIKEFESTPEDPSRLVYYELPFGVLRVLYSAGKCSQSEKAHRNVDAGVITSFDLDLKPPVKVSELGLRIEKLDRQQETDTFLMYYFDKTKGLVYSIFNDELLGLRFTLPEKYARKCSEK